MLAWPHADTDWSENLEAVERVYIQLTDTISPHQTVLVICKDPAHQSHVEQLLETATNIRFYIAPFNDTWTRDYGPASIKNNGKPMLLNFRFNGWGEKFNFRLDNAINNALTANHAWQNDIIHDIPFVLEGGSIDSNGSGALLTTSACLLNNNRSPGCNKHDVEQLLTDTLGCTQFYWLHHGYLAGDDTDSHIDTLARFTDANTIVYMACDNKDDLHYEPLKNMKEELQAFRNRDGEPFRLIPINISAPVCDTDGNRLPASYVNFLFTNDPVLLPVYGDKQADEQAFRQLKLALPDRQIVRIDCAALILQHGNLHCITMQLLEGILQPI